MPKFAMANDLWIGPSPPELQDLTLGEQLLISRARTYSKLLRLGTRTSSTDTRQRGMRGNTVSFPQDPAGVLKLLPQLNALQEFVTIVFTGADVNVLKNSKDLSVRQWKVRQALQWLKANNDAYADMVIDEAALGDLPAPCEGDDGSVMETVIAAVVQSPDDDNTEEEPLPAMSPADAVVNGDANTHTSQTIAMMDQPGDNIDPQRPKSCQPPPSVMATRTFSGTPISRQCSTNSAPLAVSSIWSANPLWMQY